MKRALVLAMVVSGCDLNLMAAYDKYCSGHACDGGTSSAGGGTSSVGGGTGGGTSSTGGGTGSTGGGATGGGDGGTNPLDTWCERLAVASCARAMRCMTVNAASCYQAALDSCDRSVRPRVRAGALTFDATQSDACIAAYNTAACSQLTLTACNTVTRPNAHLNEKCDQGDCLEGYCSASVRMTGSSGACPTCIEFADAGASCSAATCRSGWYCDTTQHCALPKADGEPCQFGQCDAGICQILDGGTQFVCGAPAIGASCTEQSPFCAPSAYCRGLRRQSDFQLIDAGTCQPRIPLSQPCAPEQFDEGCASGGSCISGTCQVVSDRLPGQSCSNTSNCGLGSCRFDQFEPDGGPHLGGGICHQASDAGEPCLQFTDCPPGTFCHSDGGGGYACTVTHGLWQQCSASDFGSCRDGLCVDRGDGGLCRPVLDAGDYCEDSVCPSNWVCLVPDGGTRPQCLKHPQGTTCPGVAFPFSCETDHCGAGICNVRCF